MCVCTFVRMSLMYWDTRRCTLGREDLGFVLYRCHALVQFKTLFSCFFSLARPTTTITPSPTQRIGKLFIDLFKSLTQMCQVQQIRFSAQEANMPTLCHSTFSLSNTLSPAAANLKSTDFCSSFVPKCKYAFPIILIRNQKKAIVFSEAEAK